MIINVDIRGNLTQAIDQKIAALSPKVVVNLIRDPLRGFWRDHLKALPSNKRGWPSTGFWEQAADSVEALMVTEGNDATLILRCTKTGVRLQALGGRVTPKTKDALTIPISPVSYGKTASQFSGLFLIKTKTGAYLVQQGNTLTASGQFKQTREKGKGRAKNEARRMKAGLNFLFKLSKGVNIPPNPRVVPSDDQFAEVAMGAIERALPDL